VTSWGKTHKYRHPSRKEQSKIFFTGYELDELFTEEEIADFMAAARRRILGEFHYATEKNPRHRPGDDRRPYRRTDNYICGVSEKLGDLAKYVLKNTRQPFIKRQNLPSEFRDLSPKHVDMIVYRAQYDVLTLVLPIMRHREIWYDEAVGIWQACQSSMDEYTEYRRVAKALKNDDRSYHGRVRAQSKARGVPEGVSVSFA
jgi:hypothetical protein